MTDSTLEGLAHRLDRMEREVRWWRRLGALSLVIVAVLVLMGQARPGPKIVEAEAFVLKDVKGKVRAVLGPMRPSDPPPPTVDSRLWQLGVAEPLAGQYGLHFYGSDGAYRAGLSQDLPIIPGEPWRLELRATGTGSEARLRVTDEGAALTLRGTEESREAVERSREEWLKKLTKPGPTFDGVEASLIAVAKSGSLRVAHMLGGSMDFALRNRLPSLSISDERGTNRAALGHTEVEREATGVIEVRPPSSLVLFNKDGKVIWKAP